MRNHITILAAVTCMTGAAMVRADKVEFKNGDVLTGTIVDSDGKTLTLKTAAANEIKIDLKEVKTFSSDTPINLKTTDGLTLTQKAAPAADGSVALNGQNYTFDKIKAINPPAVKWTGSVTAGAILTRGNTFTDQYHAAFDLMRRGEDDRITSSGAYNFGRERNADTGDKTTSADNQMLQGKYDYFLDDSKWYLFANALAVKDRIQDLNLRFVPGVGVGYQWIESAKMNFNTEAGLSWIYEDYKDEDIKQGVAARLAYHYDHTFNENVKFFHNLEFIPGLESGTGYLVNTDVGVRADMTKQMFLEAKVELTHNSQPASDNVKDDLRYILGVGWKF